jgi:beta-N-acetylhexosaminidase
MKTNKQKNNRWATILLILVLFCLAALSAYNYFEKPFLKDKVEEVVEQIQEKTEKEDAISLESLTTEEKLAQLMAVPLDLNYFEEKLDQETTTAEKQEASETANLDSSTDVYPEEKSLTWIAENEPGFVIYFGDQISTQAAQLASGELKSLFTEEQVQPLLAVDHEGGQVQRLSGEGFTKLASWKEITTYSDKEQKDLFRKSAVELEEVGINIVFAPVLDLAENNQILGNRAASDSAALYEAANNYIVIFSRERIMSVVKHFPGLGSIEKDLHFGDETITVSAEDTRIFQKVLTKFPNLGVMTAHVRLQDKLDGKICTLSEECLMDLIDNYPKALLFTDDLLMESAAIQLGTSENKEITEIAIEAVEAGNDVLVFGRGVEPIVLDQVLYGLEKEYNDSASFRAKVDASVAKILALKK